MLRNDRIEEHSQLDNIFKHTGIVVLKCYGRILLRVRMIDIPLAETAYFVDACT